MTSITSSIRVSVVVLAFAKLASAQTDAVAENLFREGKKLLAEKQYELACPKFAESARLAPSSGVELALGLCYEGEGKTASAWAAYSAVPALARRDARRDREEAATARMAALEPKLARVTFDVPAETAALDGMELKQDGVVLGSAAWTAGPIDPGPHVAEVEAPGYRARVVRFVVTSDPGITTVTIPPLTRLPPAVAPPLATRTMPAAGSSSPPAAQSHSYAPGIVVGTLGLASIAAGSVFGFLSTSSWSSAKSACGGDTTRCVDVLDGNAYRSTAETDATVSTVAFIAGGALVVTGITVLVAGATRKRDTRTSWFVVPGVARGQAGLVVAGGF